MQWLRDGLGIIESAAEIAALAATVPDTEGCFLVPAFTGLGSPWWDPYARGTIVGITRGTGRGHLARAVLESIAFQTRDVVDAMSAASGHPIRALQADGGASANDLLLQLQADQLQVPVSRPVVQETTALGAAYLAGLAEGVWSSPDDITANWRLDAPSSRRSTGDARRAHAAWRRAVERPAAGPTRPARASRRPSERRRARRRSAGARRPSRCGRASGDGLGVGDGPPVGLT